MLLGYCDMNNGGGAHLGLFHRRHFDPVQSNVLVQSNPTSGLLEIVCSRDLNANEQIVCWFAPAYLANIKSKQQQQQKQK